MTGEGTTSGDYVPAEVLDRIVDELTVLDIKRARAAYAEGDPMRGFAAVYHAAERLGLTAGSESEDSFLARVRIIDLTPLLARANATLPEGQGGTSSSPPSAASGE